MKLIQKRMEYNRVFLQGGYGFDAVKSGGDGFEKGFVSLIKVFFLF